MTIWPLAVLLVAAAAGTQVRDAETVQIRTSVKANIYTWSIKNISAPPITTIRIPQYHTYDFHGPPGWTIELSEGQLLATAQTVDDALRPGQSGSFTQRVGSAGAVLGSGTVIIGFSDGTAREIGDVWAPAPYPVTGRVIIPVCVVMIALGHASLVRRKLRRRAATTP